MKRVSIDDLQAYLARIEQRAENVSGSVLRRVRDEYKNRLATACYSSSGEDYFGSTLGPLLAKLVEILEELELRYFAKEFDADEIRDGLENQSVTKPVRELMKMLAALDSYKESIESLTGMSAVPSKPAIDAADTPAVNIDKVLSDFDAIDVFAEYQEGDAVYDSQYEEEDRQILNELFFHILDGYLDPLVVGLKSVMGGNNSQKLFAALLASIRPLRRSAETMGFTDLRTAFLSLESALKQAQTDGNLLPADRIQFVKAYGELARQLPNQGKDMGLIDILDSEKTANSMILTLIQSTAVEGWMIQALLEIGISTRKKLLSTTTEEVKAVTGLPFEQCRELLIVCRRALQRE